MNVGLCLLGEKKEETNQCRVLILVDNTSDEHILWLQRELELKSAEQGLRSRRGLYSILYLVRQLELRSVKLDGELDGHQEEPFFDLPQEPKEHEIRFLNLLNELLLVKQCGGTFFFYSHTFHLH